MNFLNQHTEFAWFVLLNSALLLALAMNVSRLRIRYKQPYGDGGVRELNQAIRAHANGIEYVPLFALNVLALSMLNFTGGWLLAIVLGFTAGRVLHAYGMLWRVFPARRGGALASYLFMVIAIVILLVKLLA
jgi:uncharacterized membrane protein YecN with MAPEG domain